MPVASAPAADAMFQQLRTECTGGHAQGSAGKRAFTMARFVCRSAESLQIVCMDWDRKKV